jgi:hypothetical protein
MVGDGSADLSHDLNILLGQPYPTCLGILKGLVGISGAGDRACVGLVNHPCQGQLPQGGSVSVRDRPQLVERRQGSLEGSRLK